MKTKLEKAQIMLKSYSIYTKMEHGSLYVYVDDYLLELSTGEIDFRAEEYDNYLEENEEEPGD